MKSRLLWVLILFSLLLVSAKPLVLRRLTVVNKSGLPLGIRLDAIRPESDQENDLFYYLTVPQGDRESPAVKEFTIAADEYSIQVYYIETYDPVYHWSCVSPAIGIFTMSHGTRLTFLECQHVPLRAGEPTQAKFGAVPRRGR